jgi:hypothetical protein
LILAHPLRGFSLRLVDSVAFMPRAGQKYEGSRRDGIMLLTSWWTGSRENERSTGQGPGARVKIYLSGICP